MADKERRNSLLKSSISINSIRDSATDFSKGLKRTNIIARGIIQQTRKGNLATSRSTAKDNEYFRKRRENIRRKNREDELESSSISGVTKKEGNIVQRSTKGFLGRILDFFGIILIGWFVNTLPKILDALGKLVNLVKRFVGILTGFVDGVREFFTGMSLGVKQALDSLPKFDFLNFKNESEKSLKQTEDGMLLLNTEFEQGIKNFAMGVNNSIFTEGVNKDGDILYGDEIEKEYAAALKASEEEENNESTDDKTQNTDTKLFGVNVGQGGIFGSIGRMFRGNSTEEEKELDKELETDPNDNFVQTQPSFIQTEAQRNAEDEKILSQANEIGDKGVDLVNKQKEKDEKSEKDVDTIIKNETNKLKTTIGDVGKFALKPTNTGNDEMNEFNQRRNELSLKKRYGGTGKPITVGDKTYNPGDEGYLDAFNMIQGVMSKSGAIVPIAKAENNLKKSKRDNTTTVIVKEVAVGNQNSMSGGSIEFDDRGLSTLNAMVNTNDNSNQMEKIHTLILNT